MTEPPPTPDEVLNTLGLHCPIPVWETAKRIRDMQPGQVLEVLSDDPGIEEDMRVWCKRVGYPLLSLTKTGAVYRALVRKR